MKTRCLVLCILVTLAFAGSAFSQNGGVEVFGGYSYQHMNTQGLNGFNAGVTGNLSRMLGITGEVSRHSMSMSTAVIDPFDQSVSVIDANASILGLRFGPKITSHMNDTASFFVQPLIGMYRLSAGGSVSGITGSTSATGFTTAMGSGFDLRVSPRIAVRPAQIDWIYLRSTDLLGVATGNSNGFRYSGGVVVKF
jgi:hypothetical protein